VAIKIWERLASPLSITGMVVVILEGIFESNQLTGICLGFLSGLLK